MFGVVVVLVKLLPPERWGKGYVTYLRRGGSCIVTRSQMCGISFYDVRHLSVDQIRQLKTDHIPLLAHRGPDGAAVYETGSFVMGFHRLSIINLNETGMQPFLSDANAAETALICNGEIYNFKHLAESNDISVSTLRSDVDVVLKLAEVKGHVSEYVSSLDGDFAFVLANKTGFQAARDHVGVRPLFYGTGADAPDVPLAFASEAKALYAAPGIHSIHVFPPSTYYDSLTGFHAFVPCPTPFDTDALEEGSTHMINRLLTKAVRKRFTHSDNPERVAVLCSGGVDSAIITTVAAAHAKHVGATIQVFTVQYDSGLSEDALYAKMLCNDIGSHVVHTVVKFSEQEVQDCIEQVITTIESYDPNTVRAAIPMYLLAKHISEKTDIKVVLSGEGADELFAGYSYFALAPTAYAVTQETARLVRNIHMFDLLRADRCFAAFGLEVRVPFLDSDLVRYVSQLDGTSMMHGTAKAPNKSHAGDGKKIAADGTITAKAHGTVTPTHGRAEKQLLRDSFTGHTSMQTTRVIDRPKEKFSDGCGFSYVPQLLNFVSDRAPQLDVKLAREKKYYTAIFDAKYGVENRAWVIERTMPEWSQKDTTATHKFVRLDQNP